MSVGGLQFTDPKPTGPVIVPNTAEALSAVLANQANMTLSPLERARALAASLSITGKGSVFIPPASTLSTSILPVVSGASPLLQPVGPPTTADGKVDPKAALARAKLMAMQMTSALTVGAEKQEAHFQDEFEINDYPAQVIAHRLCRACMLVTFPVS